MLYELILLGKFFELRILRFFQLICCFCENLLLKKNPILLAKWVLKLI